jgi:hypothetical protein
VIASAAPRLGEDGTYLGYVGSMLDIDDRRKAEERQQVLMGEMQHRTRNLPGVVRMIARRGLAPVRQLQTSRSASKR